MTSQPTPQKQHRDVLAVKKAMRKLGWAKLHDIQDEVWKAPFATWLELQTISARVRDLRKPEHGGYYVPRRYAGNGEWEYKIMRKGVK
jgi:hypothetical protein